MATRSGGKAAGTSKGGKATDPGQREKGKSTARRPKGSRLGNDDAPVGNRTPAPAKGATPHPKSTQLGGPGYTGDGDED